jgi:hypothetical protein
VIRYFLHDAVNVREMAKTYPLTNEEELLHFVHSVQLCVQAYHDRKCQITVAKVMCQFENNIEYRVKLYALLIFYEARPQSKFPTRLTASKPYIVRNDCAYVMEQ